MMFDFSGHMWSCAVCKSFNQLSSWWLLCKRYAYTLIRVSRHYYVIRMFLLCLCIFVSYKAFWSWSWSWRICWRGRSQWGNTSSWCARQTIVEIWEPMRTCVGIRRGPRLHSAVPLPLHGIWIQEDDCMGHSETCDRGVWSGGQGFGSLSYHADSAQLEL